MGVPFSAPPLAQGAAARAADTPAGEPAPARLIARDDKNNPLISTFEWTSDAAQRILRVPAGYMRNKTQERIEALARERAATVVDLTIVEAGIEIGKQMMAEMIASYSAPGAGTGTTASASRASSVTATPQPAGSSDRGYLNEVRASVDEHR
jgi:hypothetical protein